MKQHSLLDKLRRVLSILLNLAVVYMEPTAIRMSWEAVGDQTLTFYTENSNIFSAGVCLLVAVCQVWALISGRELPRWVKRLKFLAACCLTMTFLTVVFVLAPYYPNEGGVQPAVRLHFLRFLGAGTAAECPEHPAGTGADGGVRSHCALGQLPAALDRAVSLPAGL